VAAFAGRGLAAEVVGILDDGGELALRRDGERVPVLRPAESAITGLAGRAGSRGPVRLIR
jgi:hypothetical protein